MVVIKNDMEIEMVVVMEMGMVTAVTVMVAMVANSP